MRIAGALALAALAAAPAHADELPPITDRDWALDLYDGAAIGTVRIVGMGGAALATAEGSAGTLVNPAAVAVRPATSRGWWDWDFHVDTLRAVYTSDFDNNGLLAGDDTGVSTTTAGISGVFGKLGIALVATTQSTRLAPDVAQTNLGGLRADADRGKVAIARAFAGDAITVGLAARIGELTLYDVADDEDGVPLFQITGTGFEAGALWRPPLDDFRLGAAVSLPVTGRQVSVADCDPMNCRGYILPDRVEVPWQVSVGGAWRRAPTRWNQRVRGWFRDERSLLVAVDLVVTGAVPDGYGLEAFGRQELQPSGRHAVFSGRAGVEWERTPGHVRLRGGTYWEPGRFEGVGGRPHITAGIEWGFFNFCFFWSRYRLRVSLTADVAPRYGNAGVSFGFWH